MRRLLHNITTHTVRSFDNTKIYYETTPGQKDKPILFFIHGMGGDLTAWDKERQYFQDLGFPTIALDLRGHGLSGRPKKDTSYTLSSYAQDVVQIIQLYKQPITLIGHCFGGMVALTLAGEMQIPLKSLILVDTSYTPPRFGKKVANHTISKLLMLFLTKIPLSIGRPGHAHYEQFIGTQDFNPKRLFSDIWHTSLQSYLYTSKSLLSFDGASLLPKISIPTLVIEGTKDSIFPPTVAEKLAKRIKYSHLELIPGANHILVLNNPEELSSAIENFLKYS